MNSSTQIRLLGWLEDIRLAADDVVRYAEGQDQRSYLADDMRRAAIERQLITLGEAMTQLAKEFPNEAAKVDEWREVISFRNILVHRYRTLDHALIYSIIQEKLPQPRNRAAALIAEFEKKA